MSVSSNSRKESTESYAAQAMGNTMGIPPALAQLNDKNFDNDLPSRVAESSDTDVPEDFTNAQAMAAEPDNTTDVSGKEIEESKRASWGQPPVSEEDTSTENADWNTSTTDTVVPATRANEPDRTLGNS